MPEDTIPMLYVVHPEDKYYEVEYMKHLLLEAAKKSVRIRNATFGSIKVKMKGKGRQSPEERKMQEEFEKQSGQIVETIKRTLEQKVIDFLKAGGLVVIEHEIGSKGSPLEKMMPKIDPKLRKNVITVEFPPEHSLSVEAHRAPFLEAIARARKMTGTDPKIYFTGNLRGYCVFLKHILAKEHGLDSKIIKSPSTMPDSWSIGESADETVFRGFTWKKLAFKDPNNVLSGLELPENLRSRFGRDFIPYPMVKTQLHRFRERRKKAV